MTLTALAKSYFTKSFHNTTIAGPGEIILQLKFSCTCIYTVYVTKKYCIAGKFGGELNLAVWRSILQLPN